MGEFLPGTIIVLVWDCGSGKEMVSRSQPIDATDVPFNLISGVIDWASFVILCFTEFTVDCREKVSDKCTVFKIDTLAGIIRNNRQIFFHCTGIEMTGNHWFQLFVETGKRKNGLSAPASPPAIKEDPFIPKMVGLVMIPPSLYQSIERCGTEGGEIDSLPVTFEMR